MTSTMARVVPVSTPMLQRRGASSGTVTGVTRISLTCTCFSSPVNDIEVTWFDKGEFAMLDASPYRRVCHAGCELIQCTSSVRQLAAPRVRGFPSALEQCRVGREG